MVKTIKNKKSTYRRRRAIRRRAPRVLRNLANRPYLFKRLGLKTVLYSSGTTLSKDPASGSNADSGFNFSTPTTDILSGWYQFGFSHNFQLQNVLNSTEFTGLFDKYKICKVVYKIMFQQNMAPISGGTILPIIHITGDDDDTALPTNLASLAERTKVKRRVMGNSVIIKYTVRPKIATSVYRGASLTNGYAVKSGYINSDYPDVQHYGIKAWVNQLYMSVNNNICMTIEPMYYLALKEVK